MKYQVRPLKSRVVGGRTYYRVVDVVAGLDNMLNYKVVVASCNVESHAETIAKAFNDAAAVDGATGIPAAMLNRLPSYDDLKSAYTAMKDENKTLREENGVLLNNQDSYQRQLANNGARVREVEALNAEANGRVHSMLEIVSRLRAHLPLPVDFSAADVDRELLLLQHRLADATIKLVAWDEQVLTKILKARADNAEAARDKQTNIAEEWKAKASVLEARALEAETRMTMFDEDTRTKILQNSIRNAEGRASNAWRRTNELEVDVKKLRKQTRELHQHIIDAAPNRTIGDPLPEYIKRLEVRSAELTTCEDLNQKQNAAIGDLRIERDEWKDKAEALRQQYNTLLGEAKTIAKVVAQWIR